MTQQVKRAFKYRFYPTETQAAELARTFGCVRYVYNWALDFRTKAYQQRGERVSYAETDLMLTKLKAEPNTAFLAEVAAVPLQQALRHLQGAYQGFFDKRARYPRFKSRKRSKASATYTRNGFRWRGAELFLAKMAEPLNIVWSRPLPKGAHPSTVTVSRDTANRWFVSILCEDAIESAPSTRAVVGIDAGLDSLATFSTGEKVANPRHERADRKRLAKAQRELSRKQPGSANGAKARVKVARVHARIADRRRDHLHKLTTRLVRENQTIVIEDLSIRNMLKNHSLARAISDASWYEFRSMLEYKCAWYGRDLVVIDRWFPSSKLCSACGCLQDKMPLSVREWTCACGTVHDRDVNAAKNILAAGLAVSACGVGVRPQPRTRGGQPVLKQEDQLATVGVPSVRNGNKSTC